MLQIETVLCRAGKMDNYSYILYSEDKKNCVVIDPSETDPIVDRLQSLGLVPNYILNTHHHFDHTDSNVELKNLYGAKVVANNADAHRIPGFDIGLGVGKKYRIANEVAEIEQVDEDFDFEVIDVSAHTQGHVVYYFPKTKALFTGDTLFNLCVGGLFEGDPEQMFEALQKIKKLPDDVLFYPGHEYTLGGANIAYRYFGGNEDITKYLQIAKERLQKGEPAGPFSLEMEKKCNPYLMANSKEELFNLF